MRPLPLLLLALAACDASGATGSPSTASATSAQAGGGEGGEAGDGGATSTGITVASAATSTATAGGSSGDGGNGTTSTASASSSSSGSTGSGGAGGGEPGCPAAPCPVDGLICDSEACGDRWPSCDDNVCEPWPATIGSTVVRLPPVTEQAAACAEACPSSLYTLMFPLGTNARCVSVATPPGVVFDVVSESFDEPPAACHVTERTCQLVGWGDGEASRLVVISITDPAALGRSVAINISDDVLCLGVDAPECDVGCNGAGG